MIKPKLELKEEPQLANYALYQAYIPYKIEMIEGRLFMEEDVEPEELFLFLAYCLGLKRVREILSEWSD